MTCPECGGPVREVDARSFYALECEECPWYELVELGAFYRETVEVEVSPRFL